MSRKGERKKLWLPHEDEIVRVHYGKQGYQETCKLLPGRTWSDVRYRSRFLGLTGGSNLGRKYSANLDYFETPTVQNSYWAGFIAADGCVTDRDRIIVGLSNADHDHLLRMASDLGYTGKVFTRQPSIRRGIRSGESSHLGISCKKMADDLQRVFSVTPRKSLTLKPPKISDPDHKLAFINGLIDGDGCVTPKGKQRYLRISVYGTQWVLDWVKTEMDRIAPIAMRKRALSTVRPMRGRKIYSYSITSRRAEAVASAMLKLDVPRLSRKWDKVVDLLKKQPGNFGNRHNMARSL